ncbi:MAG TPA: hypothetical protein VKR55_10960 [Bradyrhizobium sp.]|uniref:hypothetical protein n=1 Tax=Bradyrhizobium sp. TaxID=376 RepID=UPI002C7F2380|nr:hypothetical protein [Bradyrhizobium sp.]HLZ02656.1 hypothetical protein [Bradyrhizobium sp.]
MKTAFSAQRTGLSFLFLGCSLALVQPAPAFGQEKQCECKFADPKWEAFGTKAACSAFVRRARTSCEISFGGLGTDPNVARSVLGAPPDYQTKIIDILRTYLELLEKNDRGALANPQFLSAALPIFMRGAYFRGPQDSATLAGTKRMDAAITGFLDKYATDVSQVFVGKKDSFSTNMGETKFEVGKGYVVVNDPAGELITSYMPGEQ